MLIRNQILLLELDKLHKVKKSSSDICEEYVRSV
jgi:hypothetical protein